MEVGASYSLAVVAHDVDGGSLEPGQLQWSSSDQHVVRVSPAGRVTAVNPGAATVQASIGRASDETDVTVLPVHTGPTVSSVEVTPPSTTLTVGQTAQLTAVARDGAGAVVTGLPVAWSSSASSAVSISPSGLATALAAGTATISATIGGVAGSATVAAIGEPPSGGDWPHEPAGYTAISDQPWDLLSLTGWLLQFGTAIIGGDATAPLSPPNVLTIIYPIGFVGGSAPGTEYLTLPMLHQVYVGTWWKASDPWQGHPSNSNKVQYLFSNGDGSMAMIMYGHPGGPYEMRVFPDWHGQWLTPNVANVPVTLGVWHQIEWLVEYGPTQDPPSGRVRWWMDGQLLGDWQNVRLSSLPLAAYKVAPVWGGAEAVVKTELDYFQYDHTYVSGR